MMRWENNRSEKIREEAKMKRSKYFLKFIKQVKILDVYGLKTLLRFN
jgi:hypothetical protein